MPEQIWFKTPGVLFGASTWTRFVPIQSMTTTEALNSVVRFSVYSAFMLAILTRSTAYLAAIPIVALASIVLYELFPNGKTLDSYFMSARKSVEKFTMPTANNPFMNVLLTDITDNPNRGDAAPVDDPETSAAIDTAFKSTSDMYMDTGDRFDQAQAKRTFHTIQSAKVPNDQDAFLNWLAKGYDEPDTSSTSLARGGKLASESFFPARGSVSRLPNTTDVPTGTEPIRSE